MDCMKEHKQQENINYDFRSIYSSNFTTCLVSLFYVFFFFFFQIKIIILNEERSAIDIYEFHGVTL